MEPISAMKEEGYKQRQELKLNWKHRNKNYKIRQETRENRLTT